MTLITPRYLYKSGMQLEALALTVPIAVEEHPNKAPLRGVLTRVDEPSTRPPNGSQGHRVLIPRAVAEAALPSLVGMPIDCAWNMKDHDKKRVVGVIEGGRIEGKDLVVDAYLLEKNYPEDVADIRANQSQLGMSYEIADVTVEDTEASVWTLTGLTFTGAAILQKSAAAYEHTAIAAHAEEGVLMPGEAKAIMDELNKMGQKLDELAAATGDEDEVVADAAADAAATIAAKKAEDDAAALVAAKKAEDAAAAEDEDEEDAAAMSPTVLAMMLKAMMPRGKKRSASAAKDDGDDDDMAASLGRAMLQAMAYPGGANPLGARRKAAEAAHDDEAEDTALFKRLIQQYTKMDAGRDPVDIEARRTRRELREMRATMDLITDTLKKQNGLITDLVTKDRGLKTDGAPARKTMSAASLERFVGQFDHVDAADDKASMTMDDINAALDKALPLGPENNRMRMAKKLDAMQAGLLKVQ